ncbi:MAG: hypothetical protein SGBAC_012318 [Bacillariaceae sp.]
MSTMAPPDSKPAAVPAASGKDALLARIQAAKAKSQQTSLKPAPTTDLLDFGAPAAAAAAPANGDFDLLGGGTPAAAPTPTTPAPTTNAGTFESLMATTTTPQPAQPSPTPPPAAAAVPEPAAAPAEPEIDADLLAALPPAEREALLAEQRQIMEEIERKKAAAPKPLTGAAAAAAAFNSRSAASVANVVASVDSAPAFARPPPVTPPRSNVTVANAAAAAAAGANDGTVNLGDGESVPLHGKEQTDQAIKDGTALVVQCMSCNNWMQVTGEANLMLCPVCGVVCPVEKTGATANMDKAAQVAADQQLAEELQKEEYKEASNYRERRRTENNVQGGAPGGQSWMDWLAGTPSPAPGTAAAAAAGRPTGATPRSPNERQGLIAGASPQRGIGGSSGGSGSSGSGGGARVAQQPTSLFACVADSITSAAEQMTGIQLSEDKEGNKISDWLGKSFEVSGLCHPHSNEFAPAFPRCDIVDDASDGSREMRSANHRALKDYYRYDDATESYYLASEEQEASDEQETETWVDMFFNGGMALLCVILGALAAGLTVGLLSLDPLLLVIKKRAGETELERQQAETLLPLVKKHHLLLVTLLLLNTVAGEALPIYLQGLLHNDSLAVIVSVVLVLVFGEIIPTALFTGPNQLGIASRLAPFVKVLMFIMWPITYPIARLLDKIMHGDDDNGNDNGNGNGGGDADPSNPQTSELSGLGATLYNRGELAALIRVQYEERLIAKQHRKHQRVSTLAGNDNLDITMDTSSDIRTLKVGLLQHQHQQQQQQQPDPRTSHRRSESIHLDEVTMMEGALQMKTKRAMDVLCSFHKVFCIAADMLLNDSNIFTVYASGYSRVPVYVQGDKRRVKGILLTRQLMVVNQDPNRNNTNTAAAATATNDRNGSGDNQDDDDAYHHLQSPPLVSDMKLYVPQCVSPDTNLIDLVNLFQTGGSAIRAGHMALVCARPDEANEALAQDQAVPEEAGLMGIITLEDVLEALLQEQIYDEMDAAGRVQVADDEDEPPESNPTIV